MAREARDCASTPGGDWLEDEIADWQRQGTNAVLSLLTLGEEVDLSLEKEALEVANRGMLFQNLPIPDRGIPSSPELFEEVIQNAFAPFIIGPRHVVHCRQGVGRTGLLAIALLVRRGWSVEAAIKRLSHLRGVPMPETAEQIAWVEAYATAAPALAGHP